MNKDRRKRLGMLDSVLIADLITKLKDELETSMALITEIKDEEQEAYDNMPESLQEGDRGQEMQEYIDTMEDSISVIGEALDSFDGVVEAVGNLENI